MGTIVTDNAKKLLADEYVERTKKSEGVAHRARQVFPGGETRSITFYDPYPASINSAAGAVLTDVDGNDYIDVLNNYTALVHGHVYGPVVEAAQAAAGEGVVYPATHEAQIALAERLVGRHPVAEKIRFTNSGTEAALLGLRVASAVTGRDRYLMFEGAYHGSAQLLTGAHSQVTRVPYNDIEAVRAALDDTYAAVMVEPCMGVGGVIAAAPDFLDQLAEAAHAVGALLVVDEVQTLRSAVGGASETYGVDADLVLMAKLIGGGYPLGAVGGRAECLAVLDQATAGALIHSGTFNGHLVAVRAGLVAVDHLDAAAIHRMNSAAETLAERVTAAGKSRGVPVAVNRFGSMLHVHLQADHPRHVGEMKSDLADVKALHLALLLEGVYAAPRGLVALSTVLTDDQMRSVADGYAAAFARMTV